jgi:hypothetical protein
MADLEARSLDPRDTRWEVWDPAYRVFFWSRAVGGGWASREFEVTGATVEDAHSWATANARPDETITLFAVVAREGETGVVRLLGDDPTRTATP